MRKEVDITTLARAMEAAYSVSSTTGPLTLQTSRVSTFKASPEGKVPVICPIESEGLHVFQARLKTALDAAGVPYDTRFPTYAPHATLSYADAPVPDQTFPQVTWGAGEITLWGGDEGDRRLIVTFPLSLRPSQPPPTQRTARIERLAVRYLELPRA